jgi:hypothetical protein
MEGREGRNEKKREGGRNRKREKQLVSTSGAHQNGGLSIQLDYPLSNMLETTALQIWEYLHRFY